MRGEGDIGHGADAISFGCWRAPGLAIGGEEDFKSPREISSGLGVIEDQTGDGGFLGEFDLKPHPGNLGSARGEAGGVVAIDGA